MNIHEHQAKNLLKKFGAPVPVGEPIFALDEIDEKVKKIKTSKIVLKAQIHAGGRGKAGGVKVVDSIEKLKLIGSTERTVYRYLCPSSNQCRLLVVERFVV